MAQYLADIVAYMYDRDNSSLDVWSQKLLFKTLLKLLLLRKTCVMLKYALKYAS